MKTFIFSALALGVMASCTNTEVEGVIDNGEPVAIRLSAGVQENVIVSRAPITDGDKFVATVLGWEKESTATVDYAATASWTSNTNEISASVSGEAITLVTPQYYDPNAAIATSMKAFSPVGTATNGVYSFTTPVKDGTQDVLVSSNVVKGIKSDTDIKVFNFVHSLTQLKFTVKGGAGWTKGSVKSITLNQVKIATGINVSDNSLVTEDVASLNVLGITDAGVEVPIVADGADGTVVGGSVMIAPTTGKSITIDVTMVDGIKYEGIEVTSTDATFVAGKAYTITLTFQNKEVSGKATVKEWETGTGTGTVQ